jgi:acyl-CoA synthetase (AMP-forming)/AMP-acid ligase II
MWLQQLILRNEVRYADRVVLRDLRRDVTFRELARDVRAMAVVLADHGAAGERVLIVSGNRVEMLEAYLACAWAGLVAVPVNPGLTQSEISGIVESTAPVMALVDPAGRDRIQAGFPGLPVVPIEEIAALPDAADARTPIAPLSAASPTAPVMILHTSATTGRPKGVVYDHRMVALNGVSWLADVPCPDGTTFLNACPLFHATMLIAVHYLAAGGTVAVLDSFTPQGCLAAIVRWRPTHAYLVPSMVQLLLEAKGLPETDTSSLELIIHGAAPMPEQVANMAVDRLGVRLLTSFGATEAGGPVLSLHHDDEPKAPPLPGAVCVGVPLPGIAAEFRDRNGQRTSPGEIGELHVGGDGLMHGYWQNPAASAEAVCDGWLNVRDLGCLDAAGYIWLIDRRNDLIIRGGQNVYPAELEAVLRRSPYVADVAVVPAPSRIWGQTPVAFIQPTPETMLDEKQLVGELLRLCVAELASYKRPSRFVMTDRIPRSPSGKTLRRLLREQVEQVAEAS